MSAGWVARLGSILFLCIQVVMLLDFVLTWNEVWVDYDDDRYLWAMLGITIASFALIVGIISLLFYYFKPDSEDCSFNSSIICLTLLLVALIVLTSISPQVKNGSLFPAALVSLYCTYIAYSSFISEPRDYVCNKLGQKLNAASASTLAFGMLLTLLSVVYSALRAGSNTALFSFDTPEHLQLLPEEADKTVAEFETMDHPHAKVGIDIPVTYNYSFFHLVFALASCYIAMLMTGWGTGAEERDLIDVGWASMYVKVCLQCLTAFTYCWMLISPNVYQSDIFY